MTLYYKVTKSVHSACYDLSPQPYYYHRLSLARVAVIKKWALTLLKWAFVKLRVEGGKNIFARDAVVETREW